MTDVNFTQGHSYKSNMLAVYDCKTEKFAYMYGTDTFSATFDQRPLWDIFKGSGVLSDEACEIFKSTLLDICKNAEETAYFTELYMKNANAEWKWFRVGFISTDPSNRVTLTFSDVDDEISSKNMLKKNTKFDELTGLLHRAYFCESVAREFAQNPSGVCDGKYAFIYFDIVKFKAINDLYGIVEGDRLLEYIGKTIKKLVGENGRCCRVGSDRFVVCTNVDYCSPEKFISSLSSAICNFEFEITFNAGVYITCDEQMTVDAMMDRAIIAQQSIKGSYTEKCVYFTDEMRNEMLSEQEIVGIMGNALSDKDFILNFQPQYNHSSGALIGAEALVRWRHPEKGIIPPSVFIPIFEKNGFITKLDLYVFEEVCAFLMHCIDENLRVVPISTNFSRFDIFIPNFVQRLEEIRKKYDVPVKYLKVELTESAVIGNVQRATEVIAQLHKCGYIIYMDDFGSGYSSLNVLKDIDLDTIKLDMKFLETSKSDSKGGTIIAAVVRMARWLDVPVIAEGVENNFQADFLKSIGCDYVQGFLYAKPLSEEGYHSVLKNCELDEMRRKIHLVDDMEVVDFWNPKSQDALVFNNYIGGTVIFDYDGKKAEILRVNQKYLEESCLNVAEKDLMKLDLLSFFDEYNKRVYLEALQRAIDTGEEQTCQTWRKISASCCQGEDLCVLSKIRVIGSSIDEHLFFETIQNITREAKEIEKLARSEKNFKMASEQVQIYFWEYDILTREMRPCFRCMRDLGLPSVVTNYPETAYEMGIFPPEVREMYTEWHERLANGEKEIEGVVPMTENRIPFVVRYTTEFDKRGRPIKAYGSATPVQ